MSLTRRRFVCASGAMVFANFVIPSARAESLSLAAAINKSGRQRMLSQRMSKAWLMVLENVQLERAQDILKQSITLFETQLTELGGLTPNDAVRAARDGLALAWNAFKPLIQNKPDREELERVYQGNEQVLLAAHALTTAYTQSAAQNASSLAKLVDLAGRQRMLSQRMMKLQLFAMVGVHAEEAKKGVAQAESEFLAAHKTLEAAPESSDLIRKELALVGQQFFFYKEAFAGHATKANALSVMASASENILKMLNEIVALYEAQAR